jgi:hypothetical protein
VPVHTQTVIGKGVVDFECSFGNGGWVRYQHKAIPVPVFLRMREADGGRLEIGELYMGDGARITGDLLRRLDLNRIEAFLNNEGEMVRARLQAAHPDLRRLIGYFATDINVRPDRPVDWVQRSFLAQFDAETVEGRGLTPEPVPQLKPLSKPIEDVEYVVDAALEVPDARPYPDDFYRAVASVYSDLAGVLRAPAGAIADANGVPVSRVHEWVKVARARGFLPKGRQGKAG